MIHGIIEGLLLKLQSMLKLNNNVDFQQWEMSHFEVWCWNNNVRRWRHFRWWATSVNQTNFATTAIWSWKKLTIFVDMGVMKYRAESNMYNLGSIEWHLLSITSSRVQLRVHSTCSSCIDWIKQGFSRRSQDMRSCEISLSTPRSYQGFEELKSGSLDVPSFQSMMPWSHAWTQYPLTSPLKCPSHSLHNCTSSLWFNWEIMSENLRERAKFVI